MFDKGFGNSGDFEAMARQYWSAWGEAMRQAGLGGAAPPPNQWQQAMSWWSQLMPGAPSQANDAMSRFNQQASQWFGQMQQVAAQFAGQDNNAAEISQAWRKAMGANGNNPFPDLFKQMRGKGAGGLDEWLDQVKPYLAAFQLDGQRWQQLPAFGQYREHQERWQALQAAQVEYQQQTGAFSALMGKCAQRAFEVFEGKLAEHEEPGRQLSSARALFDLWIDSAEEAYAGIALSMEFREVYGALANAQMRLRAAIQLEVEHMTGLFGIPSRTEVDSAHRKIAELERSLRRAASSARPVAERRSTAAAAPPPVPAKKAKRTARKAKPARKAAARKPAPKKTPVRKVASRKVAARPAMVQQSIPGTKAKRKPAAAKPSRAKPAAAKSTSRQDVAKPASRNKAAPVSTPGKVVSMKDWVARYAAANMPDAIGHSPEAGKKKARK